MASFTQYEAGYLHNWANLQIRDGRVQDARNQANRLLRGKQIYQEIESRTGVPWWFAGLCHYRESDFDFDTYLGNGQPLNRVTTEVPAGRGPFTGPNAFVDGAIDAFWVDGFLGARDWGVARVLYRLEGFNGYGYHGAGVNSPYLYGGSTLYGPPEARAGKYVRDHVFDSSVVDTQLGTAVILKALMGIDSSIVLDGSTSPEGSTGQRLPAEPDDELAQDVLWLQKSLNDLGADPRLTEDGKNGPRTMAAVSKFQRENGLPDTGLADAATIAAIQQKSTASATGGQGPGDLLAAINKLIDQLQKGSGTLIVPPPANDVSGILQQVANVLQNINLAPKTTISAAQQDQAAQLQKVLDFVNGLVNPAGKSQPLGQVNGALGQTIGNLLNGNKTAIGTIGALVTALLGNVPADSGLGQIVANIIPFAGAAGFSGYTMPIFLALAAWGVLGKLEKWSEGTAPPPRSTK
jgi:lysozyme family protein/peptidoglycan hydrolase-like protein with peptidoglycan-binding domain